LEAERIIANMLTHSPATSAPAQFSASLPASDYALASGAAPLDHLGVIALNGPDAASFIHNQLTNDFLLLDAQHARLAAYCSAKGRMQASFIGLHGQPEQLLLVCSRDLLAATLKRLSMFVLRAKVKLHDASAEYALWGLTGAACIGLHDSAAWTLGQVDGAQLIQLYPAQQTQRQLWIGAVNSAPPHVPLCSAADWALGDVLSGIATVNAPVFEAFVPQMLNYESVGGVSFKKGCYPGQEVVARSQFRGTLKRRAYILRTADAWPQGASPVLQAGQELFSAADAEQACGTVVQAAYAPDGRWLCIASLQTQAADTGGLRAGTADGPALQILPLPYALLQDI
jgi:folate-binding protein YgfZ